MTSPAPTAKTTFVDEPTASSANLIPDGPTAAGTDSGLRGASAADVAVSTGWTPTQPESPVSAQTAAMTFLFMS